MSIGTGLFLVVVGSILAFAVNIQVDWINLQYVGYLFMGAGIVSFFTSLLLVMKKRSSLTTTRSAVGPANGERVVQHETKSDNH
jgi:hypothetical protein